MDRTSREEWAKRVERWGDSGLTAKEYAAEIGIKAHTLSWWKWRLSSGAPAQGRRRELVIWEMNARFHVENRRPAPLTR